MLKPETYQPESLKPQGGPSLAQVAQISISVTEAAVDTKGEFEFLEVCSSLN